MAQFRTKARAIDLLGRNQIADLPTAITELWKNGYDAYGDKLRAELFKAGYRDVASDIFVISDDGHGMTKDDVIEKWIVLGTNSKLMGEGVPAEDRFGKEERVPLGEKGIGRLSVTYLGSRMLLLTKKQGAGMAALFMDWGILSNSDLYIDDVNIPIAGIADETYIGQTYGKLVEEFRGNLAVDTDERRKKWERHADLRKELEKRNRGDAVIPSAVMEHIRRTFEDNGGHGTMFLLFDPIDQIREIGQKKDIDDEGARDSQHFLVSALSGLFNPLDRSVDARREKECGKDYREYPCFHYYDPEWGKSDFLAQQGEFFTQDEFWDCENWIDGRFDRKGNFTGKIRVSGGEPMECHHSPRKQISLSQCGELELRLAFWEGAPRNTTLSEEAWNRYEKKGELFSGLYIYRDGFRVLPYGRTDFDFLEFEKRRSMNAGRYYFSHRKMFGYIAISKEKNPQLIDKAGREGLVSNTAYTQLKSVLRDFFIGMADQYFGRKAEDRVLLVARAREKSQQTKRLEEERKRRRKERREFLKTVYASEPKLEKAADDMEALRMETERNVVDGHIAAGATDGLYQKLRAQEASIAALRIVKPADMSLEEEEDAFNDYEAYHERYQKATERLQELKQWFAQRTYVNQLKDHYEAEVYRTLDEIDQVRKDDRGRYQKKTQELGEEMESCFRQAEDALTAFLPQNVQIDSLSEKETRETLQRLEELREHELNPIFTDLLLFLRYYEQISVGKGDPELLGAYQSANARLRRENAQIFEMAQVGMAIEQQDHQFNAMYGKIREALRDLEREPRSKEAADSFDILKMAIQHLESNYKQLQPLYHVSRKQKVTITGQDIKRLINDFYGKAMEEDGVSVRYSEDFLRSSVYSYTSIIMPVVLNIVNNALYWLGKSDDRKMELFADDGGVWGICNSGPKMQPYEMERCFDLFYSKKASGRGIGLYLAKETLRSVGMDIYTTQDERQNRLGGACFVITGELLEDG